MANKKPPTLVYALTGDEPVLIREALAALKADVGASESESFDRTELDGAEVTVSQILDVVMTAPFLSDRRTVILRRANKLDADEAKRLAEKLPSLPPRALLILVFEPGEDGRAGGPAEKTLTPAVLKAGKVIECRSLRRDALTKELHRRAGALGAKLRPAAARLLADLTSDSLTDAAAELEKTALFAGKGGTIDEPIVKKVAAPSREYKVFELLDAVCTGELGPALSNLRYLLDTSPRVDDAAMRYIFPLMHRQLRLVWQARACADEGIKLNDAAGLERVCPKTNSWPQAKSDFVRRKSAALASKLSLSQVAAMLRTLVEADMRLKGQLPAAMPRETVERMLAELCEIAAGTTAVSRR